MKKLSRLLLGLVLMSCIVMTFGVQKASAASDKLMKDFFPKGLEKVKLEKQVINNGVKYENDPSALMVYIRQNDDFLELARAYQKMNKKYTLDANYNDFNMTYGITGLDTGVQLDLSVDGSAWLYNSQWDQMDFSSTKDIPNGFYPNYSFSGSEQNKFNISFLTAGAIDSNPGVMKGAYIKPGAEYQYGKIDIENHTISIRYRYFLKYEMMDTHETVISYSAWSDGVSVGKNGNQKTLKVPDELPAPKLSAPTRALNDDGVWDSNIQVWTTFEDDVIDTELALVINKDYFEPLCYYVEIATNDLAEKEFEGRSVANAVWLDNGNRTVSYEIKGDKEKLRLLVRGYIECSRLDKKSVYAYAVPQVTGLKAKTVKTTSIKLTWSKVSGAEFYEIYDDSNKLIGTSKTNSFTVKKLKAGTGYTYKVRAVTDKVFVGLFSKELKVGTKPKKATISKVSISNGIVSVKYKKLSCTGYEVQIATDNKFKNVKDTLKADDDKTLTLVSENLGKGTYYVRARAYFTVGGKTQYGSWSKVKTVK